METSEHHGFSPAARDHAQHPRNYGPLKQFNGHSRITGPCGDTMEFWVIIEDGHVTRAAFETDGCGSSRACGSMATCLAKGMPVRQAAALRQEDILQALGGLPQAGEHCAILAANTLKAACTPNRNTGTSHTGE
jgi:nitrogen fixation protein NifU and related proteins